MNIYVCIFILNKFYKNIRFKRIKQKTKRLSKLKQKKHRVKKRVQVTDFYVCARSVKLL